MSMNWMDYSGLQVAPCLPCCNPDVDCGCSLFIPSVPLYLDYNPAKNYPYANYADSLYAINNYVSACLVYNSQYDSVADTYVIYDSYESSFDGFELLVSGSVTSDGTTNNFNRVLGWVAVTIPPSSVLSIDYSATIESEEPTLNLKINVIRCGGVIASSLNLSEASTSLSGIFDTDPLTAGQYVIFFSADGSDVAGTTSLDIAITSDKSYVVNPPIAIYSDSGDSVQLEACPKMLLPPLVEASSSFYPSFDTAEYNLIHQTTNCIGFIEESSFNEYSVSASGGVLTTILDGKYESPEPPQNSLNSWSSINALKGESLTIAFSAIGGSGTNYTIEIYNYSGELIDSYSGTSSPHTFTPLPYSGRYIIKVGFTTTLTDGNNIVVTFVASSSSTFSINPIQALYSISEIECAAREDCSCLECESKGGVIPFCGRPEFESSGGFTKWYKDITLGGSIVYEEKFSDGECRSKAEYAFSGVCSKEVGEGCNECNIVSYGKRRIYIGCTDPVLSEEIDWCDVPSTTPGNPGCEVSTTPTVWTLTGDVPVIDPPFVMTTVTGSATATLSNEDTRESAITRLLSCSDWERDGCMSLSGDSSYFINRWRIRKQDLLPLTTYEFTVKYYRRLEGSTGAWTLYSTVTSSDTTDAEGLLLTDYVDTPIEDGYETKVESDCEFTVVE